MKKVFILFFALAMVFASVGADIYGNRSSYNSGYSTYRTSTSQPRQGTYDNSRYNPYPSTRTNTGSYGQTYHTGTRGGEYYINRNNNRTYYNNAPAGVTVQQGTRGGNYYRNNNGNKVYIRKK